jgi:hypothetical protein
MKDPRDIDRRIDADLRALGAATERDLPRLSDTERALRAPAQGGTFMDALSRLRRHPRALTGLCAAAAAAALLLMPVSYERTVGHTVQLTLSGPGLSEGRVRPIVRRVRQALRAEGVQVAVSDRGVALTARLPTRSRAEARRRADAVAAALAGERIQAQVQVTPRTEQVAGRVYAMALDKAVEIRVDMTGKSARQIEDEIRAQLRSQGVDDPQVSVERSGDQTRVEIGAQMGDRELKVVRLTEGGSQQVEMKLGDLDTRREPGMTDDQLREKIERQLRDRGLTAEVTVRGDEIQIRASKHVEGP